MDDLATAVADSLDQAWSSPTVEILDDGRLAVTVPTHRYEHDAITLILERTSDAADPWTITDEGYAAFLLGVSFDDLADLMEAAPFVGAKAVGRRLELR